MSKWPSVASEFSLMADETMHIADWAELAIFVCYVDSDKHSITAKFLGLVETVGSKGAEALCEKICEVLKEKGVDVSLVRFNGFNSTNTISREISGFQRRFCHICPHSKYINSRNHSLHWYLFIWFWNTNAWRKLMHPLWLFGNL